MRASDNLSREANQIAKTRRYMCCASPDSVLGLDRGRDGPDSADRSETQVAGWMALHRKGAIVRSDICQDCGSVRRPIVLIRPLRSRPFHIADWCHGATSGD